MVGFILGLIAIAIGVIVGVVLKRYSIMGTVANSDNERVKVKTNPFKKYSAIPVAIGIVLGCIGTFCGSIVSVTTGNTGVVLLLVKLKTILLSQDFILKLLGTQ